MRKKIVHVVTNDKFTTAYINFMKMNMTEYAHFFCVSRWSNSKDGMVEKDLVDEENIIRFENGKQLAFGTRIRKLIKESDKIIVSGIFGIEQLIYFWPQNVYKKLYLHYWGGDFYQLRKKIPLYNFQEIFQRHQLKYCFRKSKGAIFLIKGEYEKYQKITGIVKNETYVASMPFDPNKEFPFTQYRNIKNKDSVRVIIGNSATYENRHEEVLKLMTHLKDENIEIYCPLSYGDEKYGKRIETIGEKIFGEKFYPVLEWMEAEDYYRFLSTCDIGIFGNDRQQGMGNIIALLKMGKKIYMRTETSMYEEYKRLGFKCYNLENIGKESFEEFILFPERMHNEKIADEWDINLNAREEWIKVFEAQN